MKRFMGEYWKKVDAEAEASRIRATGREATVEASGWGWAVYSEEANDGQTDSGKVR